MNANRIWHRLAFSSRGGRAVIFEEKVMNDGGLSIRNLQKQITFAFGLSPQYERNFLICAFLTYMRLRLAEASFFLFPYQHCAAGKIVSIDFCKSMYKSLLCWTLTNINFWNIKQ